LLHLAYRKLPISLGKHLAYSVQRLDLVGSLRPRAVQAGEHFENCPPDCRPPWKRQEFEKRYFSHLLQNIVDFQCLEAMTPAQVEDWFSGCVDYEGLEHLANAKSEGRPVILGGFHFSCTKLIALLLMRLGYDTTQVWLPDGRFDMDSVEKRLDVLRKLKPGYGRFSNIPDFSLPSYRRLLQSVRNGEVLVWFGDKYGERKQHEAKPQSEEWRAQAARVFGFSMVGSEFEQSKLPVSLCGRRVYLNSWIGAFARMTGATVVPAALIRRGSRMRMIFKPALRLPSRATAKDVEALNRALFFELDLLLRLYPDQWFGWHSLNPVRESETKDVRLAGDEDPVCQASNSNSERR
jgi:lauroyl/myristoyl acyltransferase